MPDGIFIWRIETPAQRAARMRQEEPWAWVCHSFVGIGNALSPVGDNFNIASVSAALSTRLTCCRLHPSSVSTQSSNER